MNDNKPLDEIQLEPLGMMAQEECCPPQGAPHGLAPLDPVDDAPC